MSMDKYRRAVRDKLGLSQTQLANTLGVTVRTVSRWDTGHGTPTPAIQRLIDELVTKNSKSDRTLESFNE